MIVNISFYNLPLMSFALPLLKWKRNYYPLSPAFAGDSRNTFQAPPPTKEWASQEQRGVKLTVLERTLLAGSPHPTPTGNVSPVSGRLLPANPDLFNCERTINGFGKNSNKYSRKTEQFARR
jgi:hypothetical protein